jgi:hypothetical protein
MIPSIHSMLDICLTLEPSFSNLEDLGFLSPDEVAAVNLLGKEFRTNGRPGMEKHFE